MMLTPTFQSVFAVIKFYPWGDNRSEGMPFGDDSSTLKVTERATERLGRPSYVQTWKEQSSITGPIVSLQVTKTLGSPTGEWSLTLMPMVSAENHEGTSWDTHLFDGDWVEINVIKNGEEAHLMVGRVDTIQMTMSVGADGTPHNRIVVTGRDFGAVAADVPIYYNPYDPLHNNVAGHAMVKHLGGVEGRISGSPNELVVPLLVKFAGSEGTFGAKPTLPPGFAGTNSVQWADYVDTTEFVEQVRGIVHAPNILQTSEAPSLWEFASRWRNPTMNEMWFDTKVDDVDNTRKGYLFFREKPFETVQSGKAGRWFQLPAHAVDLNEVTAINVGRGQNRVNHIQVLAVTPVGFTTDTMLLFKPVANIEDIERWGLRRLEEKTPFMSTDGTGAATFAAGESLKWRDLVVSWNSLNPYYWLGTISLATLRPEIRVGSKIVITGGPSVEWEFIPDDGGYEPGSIDCRTAMTFYVEGVQHMFTEGDNPTALTQIQVTRGYPEDRRLPDLEYEFAKFKDADNLNDIQKPLSAPYRALTNNAIGGVEV